MLTITMEDDEGDDGLDFLEREFLGEGGPTGDGDEEEEDLEKEIVGHAVMGSASVLGVRA